MLYNHLKEKRDNSKIKLKRDHNRKRAIEMKIQGISTGICIVTLLIGLSVEAFSEVIQDLPFWKKEVIYQIYPRSLYDAVPDGTGDIKGIIKKVDYIKKLGVGIVWLNPIYKSPMADFGYDASNFTDIDPIFGTLQDFDEMIAKYHEKGLKIIMDFVPNHSSDEHEWFRKSEDNEQPYSDYYIWRDPGGCHKSGDHLPPNNWVSAFGGSAWTWSDKRQQFYLHQYLDKQPDLNYRNLAVREEILKVLRFWLDRGVDGFRIDALYRLVETEDFYQDEPRDPDSNTNDPLSKYYLRHTLTVNQLENFEVLREWRKLLDEYKDKFMVVEVRGSMDEVMRYYGNDTDPLADFPFNFFILKKLKLRSTITGHSLKADIDQYLNSIPSGKWPNWVLGTHDHSRIGSRLGNDLIDAMNMLQMLLPGTPTTYYGEEIGMTNTPIKWEEAKDTQALRYGPEQYVKYSRDPSRTPMQWDNTAFAGFTKAKKTWLPVNENYKTLNVQEQEQAKFSHLKVYQTLTQLRRGEAFQLGDITFPFITEDIFSFLRYTDGADSYLIVINTSEEEIEVNLREGSKHSIPEMGTVVLRSITDTSPDTQLGAQIALDSVKMVGGEGIVIALGTALEEELSPHMVDCSWF